MARHYTGRRRRTSSVARIVNSIKNVVNTSIGTTGTLSGQLIALATNSPLSTVQHDVENGCVIKAVYLIVDGCGLGGTGVLNDMAFYFLKNPGANLTPPGAFVVGTSNEKKFVFRQWKYMIMRNQDGNTPFHWEGWIPIPKRYQRMGVDDTLTLQIANTSGLTGHFSFQAIYKWYT